jgi:hypothetical protein
MKKNGLLINKRKEKKETYVGWRAIEWENWKFDLSENQSDRGEKPRNENWVESVLVLVFSQSIAHITMFWSRCRHLYDANRREGGG